MKLGWSVGTELGNKHDIVFLNPGKEFNVNKRVIKSIKEEDKLL